MVQVKNATGQWLNRASGSYSKGQLGEFTSSRKENPYSYLSWSVVSAGYYRQVNCGLYVCRVLFTYLRSTTDQLMDNHGPVFPECSFVSVATCSFLWTPQTSLKIQALWC